MAPRVLENATGDTALAACVTGAVAELKIVEREGSRPWAFTADWTMRFQIARPRSRRGE